MEIVVNLSRCNGCGFCMDVYPDLFQLGKRYSNYVGPKNPDEATIVRLKGSVLLCPAIAISLSGYQSD